MEAPPVQSYFHITQPHSRQPVTEAPLQVEDVTDCSPGEEAVDQNDEVCGTTSFGTFGARHMEVEVFGGGFRWKASVLWEDGNTPSLWRWSAASTILQLPPRQGSLLHVVRRHSLPQVDMVC